MPAAFLRRACCVFHLLCPGVIPNQCLQCQSSGEACHEAPGRGQDSLWLPTTSWPRGSTFEKGWHQGRIEFREHANKPKSKAKQEPPERQGHLAAQVSTSLDIQELQEQQAGAFCPDQTRWGVWWQTKYSTVGYHTCCAIRMDGH